MYKFTRLTQEERELLIALAARYRSLGNYESAKRCLAKANASHEK